MRNAIRTKLLSICPRVYQPATPTKSTEKPYIVIRMGNDIKRKKFRFDQVVQIWPYVEKGDYNNLSALVAQIVDTFMDSFLCNGETVRLNYEGSIGDEYPDPDWDALTHGLEFSYVTIHERR